MTLPTPDQPILGEKYRLIRLLGAGGMGTVWVAEHLQLHSLVAVKFINRVVAATPAGTQRFLREARAAASLRSPHVVQILDYGLHEGTPFIAMELLEGESLAARLERDGRLRSLEQTALVFRQIARAVARAHDAGIIHRDLKPANIFLVRNDEEEIVKLLDFGVAKLAASADGFALASRTRTGEFLGSPAYSSPEQLEGSKTLDQRTDIWSFGVLAFECLIGRTPFGGKTIAGVVLAVCSKPLPVPSEVGPVPAGFDAWFARACARKVELRFQSMREAASELRSLLEAALGARVPISRHEGAALSADIVPVRQQFFVPDLDLAPESLAPHSGAARRPSSERTRAGIGASSLQRRPSRAPLFTLGALALALILALAARSRRTPVMATVPQVSVRALVPAKLGEQKPEPHVRPIQPSTELRVFGDAAGSILWLDGKEIGPLPEELKLLAPGEHTIKVSAGPRYEALEQRVLLEPDQPRSIGPVRLRVIKGLAKIQAGPSAKGADLSLRVAGSRRLLPGLPLRLDVETDVPHLLVAQRKGYATLEEPLVFEDGQAEKTFEINLTPLPAANPDRAARDSTPAPGKRGVPTAGRNRELVERRAEARELARSPLEAAAGDGLEPILVQQTVHRYSADVRDDCWERALGAQPRRDRPSSRITATLIVETSGHVRSVAMTGAASADPDLARCVEGKLYTWTFPAAAAETVINVPFVFVAD